MGDRIWQRWLIFAVLAAGMAHAINKLFIPELEADQHVYAGLLEGAGPAPDQYRILPLMLLKPFVMLAGWSHGVLISSWVAGLVVLHQLWIMASHRSERLRYTQGFLFAMVFIFTLVTGWRPETLWVMAIFNLTVPLILGTSGSWASFFAGVLLLSVTRADVAAWLCGSVLFMNPGNWGKPVAGILTSILIQVTLMKVIFPGASYYTQVIMIKDNLSGWYFLRNPSTYFILGAILIWFRTIKAWFSDLSAAQRRLLMAAFLYSMLIFVIGRVNEYRLYLWFLPLFWWVDNASLNKRHG